MSKPYNQIQTLNGCLFLCISHVLPLFELPEYVYIIKTGDFDHPNAGVSLQGYLEGRFPGTPIPSYQPDYAILVIEDILRANIGRADRVCVLLHRKLTIAHRQGTWISNHNTFLDLASNVNLQSILPDLASEFILMPMQLRLDSVIGQYAAAHHLNDFLQLSDLCVQLGVIGFENLKDFYSSSRFIPGGGILGVLPFDIALPALSRVNTLTTHILCNGFQPVDPCHPYQSRAVSFFIERLASYFTLTSVHRISNETGLDISQAFTGAVLTATGDEEMLLDYPPGAAW